MRLPAGRALVWLLVASGLLLVGLGVRNRVRRTRQPAPASTGASTWRRIVVAITTAAIVGCAIPSLLVAVFGVRPEWRESLLLAVVVYLQALGALLVLFQLTMLRRLRIRGGGRGGRVWHAARAVAVAALVTFLAALARFLKG